MAKQKVELGEVHFSHSPDREPKLDMATIDTIDDWAKKMAEHAQKGSAKGIDCGKMCTDCAFKYEQPKTADYYESVDDAMFQLMYGLNFNCHTPDYCDSGKPCAGFLYAKLFMDDLD